MPSLEELSPTLSTLKPTTQSVLIQLCAHHVNDEVTASQTDLATWSGIKSRNTIRAAIRELLDCGLMKVIKAGQEGSISVFHLSVPGKRTSEFRTPVTPTIKLSSENQVLLAAIKKSLSPAAWGLIRKEAALTGASEDDLIIKRYFGPERLNG